MHCFNELKQTNLESARFSENLQLSVEVDSESELKSNSRRS